MPHHYIATVNVSIDDHDSLVVPVVGFDFEMNSVKKTAEDKVKELNPGKRITSVLLNKRELDITEYAEVIAGNSPWLVIAGKQ